jgi:hypothetical protein
MVYITCVGNGVGTVIHSSQSSGNANSISFSNFYDNSVSGGVLCCSGGIGLSISDCIFRSSGDPATAPAIAIVGSFTRPFSISKCVFSGGPPSSEWASLDSANVFDSLTLSHAISFSHSLLCPTASPTATFSSDFDFTEPFAASPIFHSIPLPPSLDFAPTGTALVSAAKPGTRPDLSSPFPLSALRLSRLLFPTHAPHSRDAFIRTLSFGVSLSFTHSPFSVDSAAIAGSSDLTASFPLNASAIDPSLFFAESIAMPRSSALRSGQSGGDTAAFTLSARMISLHCEGSNAGLPRSAPPYSGFPPISSDFPASLSLIAISEALRGDSGSKLGLILSVGLGVLAAAVILALVILVIRRRRRNDENSSEIVVSSRSDWEFTASTIGGLADPSSVLPWESPLTWMNTTFQAEPLE